MFNRLWDKLRSFFGGSEAGDESVSRITRVGRIGERHAAELLRKKGYKILDQNWRCAIGEIDLVAAMGDILVIVEVKTRTSVEFGAPMESVGSRKQRKLISLARFYMIRNDLHHLQPRFDVFSILLDDRDRIKSCEHIDNAFIARGFQS